MTRIPIAVLDVFAAVTENVVVDDTFASYADIISPPPHFWLELPETRLPLNEFFNVPIVGVRAMPVLPLSGLVAAAHTCMAQVPSVSDTDAVALALPQFVAHTWLDTILSQSTEQ